MTTQEIIYARSLAGARAMGMLEGLLRHGHIPPHHVDHAREIIAAWPKLNQLDRAAEAEQVALMG